MVGPRGTSDVVVIGAGVAGLTAAALLALDGASVTVLEQHAIAGGCASFFGRPGGYRFDAGATVAGGFGTEGIHRKLFEALGMEVAAERVDPAMVVHLPEISVTRYGDGRWLAERRRCFGPEAEPFWNLQERIADLAWDFAGRMPALPRDVAGFVALCDAFRPRHLALAPYLGRTLASVLPDHPLLRRFVDAQLLITAQTGASGADLLYGMTALDLARAGTYHLRDGVAAIAMQLARGVRKHGGAIRYNTAATRITVDAHGRVSGVDTADGSFAARTVIAAIPRLDASRLLPPRFALRMAREACAQPQRWGAFMLYAGIAPGVVPEDLALHHQVVASTSGPMGEGRTVFLSFSAAGERAPRGGRALTMSTHTDAARWERAFADGTLEAAKAELRERFVAALERVVPGAARHLTVVETATPHTFERYTLRSRGFVGGMPANPVRANILANSHHSGVPGLVMCGDSVFPGQSTVGTALSGVAAAAATRVSRRSVREIFRVR